MSLRGCAFWRVKFLSSVLMDMPFTRCLPQLASSLEGGSPHTFSV